jgi:FlaA1/EpsC-like NDP-sugar epimerase
VKIIQASAINNVVYAIIIYLIMQIQDFPRSIVIIDWGLYIMIFAGIRLFYRYYRELFDWNNPPKNNMKKKGKKRCLIIGAGDGAESLIRFMINNQIDYEPVCIVDKDPKTWNRYIHGIKIHGPLEKIHELAIHFKVEEIIIAIPSATERAMRDILEYLEPCLESNIGYKTVPSLDELLSGNKPLTAIRDIKLEDLISRDVVVINKATVGSELKNKVAIVTGAAGSIGSELVRQIAQFDLKNLILLDRNENNLMYLIKEIDDTYPDIKYKSFIVDITNENRLDTIFKEYKPDYIFHAAAYKHVPFMEDSPDEAVKNNVYGTKVVATIAEKYHAYKFVLISTDKAVNPVNIMGCTKKLAENCLLGLFYNSPTKFIVVRFGNVLGSEGSVIPIFKRQIKYRRPITVTHPDMRRFLMTIPEAVSLTLEASSIGHHRDILVLDMGKQIKILDIAENLIRLSGLKPYVDIPIKFTGIRPGEKLYEELWDEYENPINTQHPKIFKVPHGKHDQNFDLELFDQLIQSFFNPTELGKELILLKKLVPTFVYPSKKRHHTKKTA